jgi:hypothetical protein
MRYPFSENDSFVTFFLNNASDNNIEITPFVTRHEIFGPMTSSGPGRHFSQSDA